MNSDHEPQQQHVVASTEDGMDRDQEDANHRKAAVRKRTKTGCLTCRKRRIKCGEERPTCCNCLKSKRKCEGYCQRVIFKDPINAFNDPRFPAVFPQGAAGLPIQFGVGATASRQNPSSSSSLQAIAPRPPAMNFYAQGQARLPYGGPIFSQPPPPPAAGPAHHHHHHHHQNHENHDFSGDFHSLPGQNPTSLDPPNHQHNHHHHHHHHQQALAEQHYFFQQQQQPQSSQPHLVEPPVFTIYPRLPGLPNMVVASESIERQLLLPIEPPVPEPEGAIPQAGDDVLMGESDDERDMRHSRRTFRALVTSHHDICGPVPATQMRSFSSFAQHSILAKYDPSAVNSPLNDTLTAAVFAHFVSVTGPSMSLYERHPFDGSRFLEELNSNEGQNIWTYTFPILAFKHPALMQSILALGALQIATLQRAPPTAAMKHYHLAIRRLARNVQSTTRRNNPATLAATLLLSYFEVWSSDHSKWCNHLYGARILLREIKLREMTRKLLPIKRARQYILEVQSRERLDPFGMGPQGVLYDEGKLDVDLLSQITGVSLTAADCGQADDYGQADDVVMNNSMPDPRFGHPQTDWEIETYEHLRDLYWWYCKMDIYQSMLGGTKLFMDYRHWTQCPPRSPLGQSDTMYGTYDHVMLLLGRLCDFASRDWPRKRRSFKHQGPPGTSPPMAPGILPSRGNVTAPMGFTSSSPVDSGPQSPGGSEDGDLDAAMAAATREWESIRDAFDALKARLGPNFEPLGPQYSDRRDSPFGPTLQYRTFSMAGIWMNYYMGLIHLHRSHPAMPPVAMMAVGAAAPETALFANEIGRIAAGLADDVSDVNEISTLVGAALIESCFCLFVAAVQYREAEQRHWMVRRMHDISRLTGWQSARQIADGCESGWLKAHQMGRGPEYRILTEITPGSSSIWANPRRIDRVIHDAAENRLVLARSERAHYALGLLSVERDLEQLELNEKPL